MGHLFRLQNMHCAVSSVLSFILFGFDTVICTNRLDMSTCIHRQNEEVKPVILKSTEPIPRAIPHTGIHSPCPARDQPRAQPWQPDDGGPFCHVRQKGIHVVFKVSDLFYFMDLSVLNKHHHGGTVNPHMGPACWLTHKSGIWQLSIYGSCPPPLENDCFLILRCTDVLQAGPVKGILKNHFIYFQWGMSIWSYIS